MKAKTILTDLLHDERGATAVEYGLICALIVLVILGAMQALAGETIALWNTVSATSVEAINRN